MKFYTIFTTVSFCVGCASCWCCNSIANQASDENSAILAKILANFLKRYFSDEKMFISIVQSPPARYDGNHSHEEFFNNLRNDSVFTGFAFNILDKLDSSTPNNRNTFNVILVDNWKILQ